MASVSGPQEKRPQRERNLIPDVEGPITGGRHGRPFASWPDQLGDLAALGYREEEYFVSGEAQRFEAVGDLGSDGRWTVRRTAAAAYRTRILVRRPEDPARFNGTAVVEWVNVSSGFEIPFLQTTGILDGFAYVSVSAQPVGVHGFAHDSQGLVAWDPDRYGCLHIADESLSYDIFTQVGRLLRAAGTAPLGGFPARRLIATGGSQSGSRLVAYLNAIQTGEGMFDAVVPMLVAGRGSDFLADTAHHDPRDRSAARRGQGSRAVTTQVRDDLTTPVIMVNTESEAQMNHPVRRDDSPSFRYWEVAGATHGPRRQMELYMAVARRDGIAVPGPARRKGSLVDWLPVADAVLHQVHEWINGGEPPLLQPRFEMTTGPDGKPEFVRDSHGLVVGGVRQPEIEVPLARNGGDVTSGAGGFHEPFSADELRALYPSREDYLARVRKAAAAARERGVILPARADACVAEAEGAPVPPQ
ncbi:hypothetical protein JJ691_20840 [Kutzneria sp. CA-103260]|nr:hypothetical protein JJ691_20840 [Kutzneria sp. CA-103260]